MNLIFFKFYLPDGCEMIHCTEQTINMKVAVVSFTMHSKYTYFRYVRIFVQRFNLSTFALLLYHCRSDV